MISVVVPAHNEEAVIARCLQALLAGATGALEVLVACNGCRDRTAEIARGFGPTVRVLELDQASKIAALNAGDEAATGFPRFYIDADVVVTFEDLRRMAAALERGALLAAPEVKMDLSATSWSVRAFYRVWTALPYNQVMVGTGAYGLSREGRSRFGRFPDVIADDGYVRSRFAPHERVRVAGAVSRVDPPRTLPGLLRIKTRSRMGHYQLERTAPNPAGRDPRPPGGLARFLLGRPGLWPAAPVYFWVNLVTRRRARRQLRHGSHEWERDDSRPGPPRAAGEQANILESRT